MCTVLLNNTDDNIKCHKFALYSTLYVIKMYILFTFIFGYYLCMNVALKYNEHTYDLLRTQKPSIYVDKLNVCRIQDTTHNQKQ